MSDCTTGNCGYCSDCVYVMSQGGLADHHRNPGNWKKEEKPVPAPDNVVCLSTWKARRDNNEV